MFRNCSSLEYLELGNFDTSLVTNMNYMFYNCKSLKSLNLYSFNTSKLTSFNHTFDNINLSSYCINDGIKEDIKNLLSSYTKMNCSDDVILILNENIF